MGCFLHLGSLTQGLLGFDRQSELLNMSRMDDHVAGLMDLNESFVSFVSHNASLFDAHVDEKAAIAAEVISPKQMRYRASPTSPHASHSSNSPRTQATSRTRCRPPSPRSPTTRSRSTCATPRGRAARAARRTGGPCACTGRAGSRCGARGPCTAGNPSSSGACFCARVLKACMGGG